MKRISLIVLSAALSAAIPAQLRAQTGMDMFAQKAIADFFKPVVGRGVAYETERNGKKDTSEMTIVGKESVDGKDGFWMETGKEDKRAGVTVYAKVLVTPGDFKFHRSISQLPGQQPVEYTFNTDSKPKTSRDHGAWHKVGMETITVPAGSFACEHWAKDDGTDDIWLSSKVSPMGVVKEVKPRETMLLVKVITDAKDHITGTPKKFDIEAMKKQMMEKMQEEKKKKP